ncbi:hypothetical protein AB8O64_22190 [Streptomyces sp. QH1-20]|uniref:hypothetical protein n=1 Tax=Streptomyces sp. QH1-20 TaxID=3240934 RepID=UPI00351574BE
MRAAQKVGAIASAAVAAFALTAGIAHAEGGFDSYASNWVTGKESRHWDDNNSDGASTTVRFSGCSASNSAFRYAGIQLKRDRSGLPDPVVDRSNNYCNTSNFGRQSGGTYYFNYSNLNGDDAPRSYLNVSSIAVRY